MWVKVQLMGSEDTDPIWKGRMDAIPRGGENLIINLPQERNQYTVIHVEWLVQGDGCEGQPQAIIFVNKIR